MSKNQNFEKEIPEDVGLGNSEFWMQNHIFFNFLTTEQIKPNQLKKKQIHSEQQFFRRTFKLSYGTKGWEKLVFNKHIERGWWNTLTKSIRSALKSSDDEWRIIKKS